MSQQSNRTAFATIYQLGYVSNDLDRAVEVFRARYGVPEFRDLGAVTLTRDEGGEARIRFALCFAGTTQLEIIEPRGGEDSLYTGVLPKSGFGLVWHHVAFKMPTVEALEEKRAGLVAAGNSIAFSGGNARIAKFFYIDARSTLGHYVEYLYLSPEREAMHASLPRH